jgi:hypothetical protein
MQIAERFPRVNKVFEVPAQEAEENLRLVLRRIAEEQTGAQALDASCPPNANRRLQGQPSQ